MFVTTSEPSNKGAAAPVPPSRFRTCAGKARSFQLHFRLALPAPGAFAQKLRRPRVAAPFVPLKRHAALRRARELFTAHGREPSQFRIPPGGHTSRSVAGLGGDRYLPLFVCRSMFALGHLADGC